MCIRDSLADRINGGFTLLHVASGAGAATTVEWLLERTSGKSLNDVDNEEGLSPLHCCVLGGSLNFPTVEKLVNWGADTTIMCAPRPAATVNTVSEVFPLFHTETACAYVAQIMFCIRAPLGFSALQLLEQEAGHCCPYSLLLRRDFSGRTPLDILERPHECPILAGHLALLPVGIVDEVKDRLHRSTRQDLSGTVSHPNTLRTGYGQSSDLTSVAQARLVGL